MASNRRDTRLAWAALLAAELVGDGQPVEVVYSEQTADLGGQSPVICISSGGTERDRLTYKSSHAYYYIDVDVFVLYSAAGEGWTEADAESMLDDIERRIAAIIDAHQEGAHWHGVEYVSRSTTDYLSIGGVEYKRERIPLRLNVFA